MTIIIRAFTKDGYHRDLYMEDERQIWMHEGRVKEGKNGMSIDPKDFPEMDRFEIVVKRD